LFTGCQQRALVVIGTEICMFVKWWTNRKPLHF